MGITDLAGTNQRSSADSDADLVASQRLRRRRSIPLLPVTFLVVLVLVALSAPLVAPHPPNEADFHHTYAPPAWESGGSTSHLLGTDKFGRDIFSRIMNGARYSLLLAAIALTLGAITGTIVGIVAGYFGGWVDNILMRIVDMMLSIPIILIALVLATLSKPSFQNVVFILAVFLWAAYARQLRAEVLGLREREFILLARVAGRSSAGIMFRHVLPNIQNTLIILITLQLGTVILLESSLSFLGVGVPPPTPAWGLMVADGREVIGTAWWVSFFPGLAIALTVLSLNLLGDWLRDRFDPKLRQL